MPGWIGEARTGAAREFGARSLPQFHGVRDCDPRSGAVAACRSARRRRLARVAAPSRRCLVVSAGGPRCGPTGRRGAPAAACSISSARRGGSAGLGGLVRDHEFHMVAACRGWRPSAVSRLGRERASWLLAHGPLRPTTLLVITEGGTSVCRNWRRTRPTRLPARALLLRQRGACQSRS